MAQTNSLDKQEIQNPTIVNNKYIAQSQSCVSVDTITPESMRYDMLKAIETIDRRVNGVDEYVAERLGYIVGSASLEEKKKGIKYLCDAFSSEQVDAIAVAIYNIESKGQGCIIGDQTGIGKGRIAAAMIRYGIKRGLKPIFITEKVNLFSDIFRDIIAIGSDSAIPYKVLVGTKEVEKKTIKKVVLTKEELDEIKDSGEEEEIEEETEFTEVEVYQKNKNFPNKFIYVKKDENEKETTITRVREVSSVPFILNRIDPKTKKKVDIKDEDGHVLYSADSKLIASVIGSNKKTDEVIGTTPSGNPKYKHVFVAGTMQVPSSCDFVLATYSQFNVGKASPKADFLFNIAQNNIIIMDESHNASGTSNVGIFLKEVLSVSLGVTFLSATFAKRPDNMPIYASKTSMSDANMGDEELVGAIISGGVALQEIVSSALVSEGQMVRRERSFEGIEVNYKFLDASQREIGKNDFDLQEIHTAIMDRATDIIRNIIRFQKEYVDPIIASMDKEMKNSQGQVKKIKGLAEGGIKNTPAFSGIFNLINQLLFSLKAESVGKIAVERLQEGKKPIISFANTMESFLNELKNDDGEFVKEGDIVNSDFGMVFEKRLKNTLKYKVIASDGEETFEYLNPMDFEEKFKLQYMYILNKIKSTSIGICSSPIDVVIDVIKKAGFSVSEVTGRKRQLKLLGNDQAQIMPKKQESPNDAFRRFNNNEVDVLMINQSGSTGASAHAVPTKKVPKEKVKQRVMIFLQSELNVNTEVQKRGRINRTGQILKPIYDYVVSSVPAEKRLIMMLQKKLKSLSANTTSSQNEQGEDEEKNLAKEKNIDFLNKYGDKVILEFLIDNPLINIAIDDPLGINSSQNPQDVDYTDASQKVSGRIAILSIKDQDKFYTEITSRYIALVLYLIETDEYDLKVKNMDLKAETLSKSISIVGKGGKSVFAKHTILERCMVNNLKKPFKSEEVKILLDKSQNGLTPEQIKENLIQSFSRFINTKLANDIEETNKYFEEAIKNIPKQKAILKIDDDAERIEAIAKREEDMRKDMVASIQNLEKITENKKSNIIGMFEFFEVGKLIYFPSTTYAVDKEKIRGVFIGFAINDNEKNPYAPSSMKLKFALQNALKFVSVPASKFDIISLIRTLTSSNIYYKQSIDDILANWNEQIREKSEDRTIRYIVTGNILQGFGKIEMRGNLISYTTINGGIKKGILLPESFVKGTGSSDANNIKVPIMKALPLIRDLSKGDSIKTNGNLDFGYGGTDYGGEKYYSIEVPKSAKLGSKYYTDSNLIELSRNGTFNSVGQKMVCLVNASRLTETITYLQDKFNLSVELRPYQFEQIEHTIEIDDEEEIDNGNIESDEFLNRLNEANRQEEERRKEEQERLEREQKEIEAKRIQEQNQLLFLLEKKRNKVRHKLNSIFDLLNNEKKFKKGGNISKNNDSDELNSIYNVGDVYTHKHSHSWGQTIDIRLISPTKKGWKVEQKIKEGDNVVKTKIAFLKKSEINEFFELGK